MKRTYAIPMNFMETGYVLNGAVSIRNAIEAGVLGLLGYLICKMLPLPSGMDAISYYIFIIAPFVLLGAYGVQGDPISVFVMDLLKWRKHRRPYFYSSHSEAYTQEAAEMVLDAPQMRDMLADVLDSVKEKLAPEEDVYVEGKTFQFAADPEQAALKDAQAELLAKQTEKALEQASAQEQSAAQQDQKPAAPFIKPSNAQAVSAEQISQMLVLDELQWEEDTEDGQKE